MKRATEPKVQDIFGNEKELQVMRDQHGGSWDNLRIGIDSLWGAGKINGRGKQRIWPRQR